MIAFFTNAYPMISALRRAGRKEKLSFPLPVYCLHGYYLHEFPSGDLRSSIPNPALAVHTVPDRIA
jgi:hypothetical protein